MELKAIIAAIALIEGAFAEPVQLSKAEIKAGYETGYLAMNPPGITFPQHVELANKNDRWLRRQGRQIVAVDPVPVKVGRNTYYRTITRRVPGVKPPMKGADGWL